MKNKFIFLAIVLLTTVFANASNGSYKIRYEEIKCSIQNSSQSTNLNMDKISDMKFTMPITINASCMSVSMNLNCSGIDCYGLYVLWSNYFQNMCNTLSNGTTTGSWQF